MILPRGWRPSAEQQHDFRFRRKDGSDLWAIVTTSPFLDERSRHTGSVAMVTDITERVLMERSLRESQQRLNLTLEAVREGLWDVDLTTGAAYVGHRFHDILGHEAGEIPQRFRAVLALIHPDDREDFDNKLREYLRGGRELFKVDVRLLKKDGSHVWTSSRCRVIEKLADGRPKRMIGTITDVTDRKELETKILQAQKAEAIGRLTGGIAHDFNNLLTVINGYATLLANRLPLKDPSRSHVESIQSARTRAAALTPAVASFSRRQVLQPVVLGLDHVVEEIGLSVFRNPFTVLTWQFPVLAKYRVARARFSPFLEGGPSLRLSGNNNGYNPSWYGATVGAGVEVASMGGVRLSPAVRYTRWAKDEARSRSPGYDYSRTAPNQLEILVGFSF